MNGTIIRAEDLALALSAWAKKTRGSPSGTYAFRAQPVDSNGAPIGDEVLVHLKLETSVRNGRVYLWRPVPADAEATS